MRLDGNQSIRYGKNTKDKHDLHAKQNKIRFFNPTNNALKIIITAETNA